MNYSELLLSSNNTTWWGMKYKKGEENTYIILYLYI